MELYNQILSTLTDSYIPKKEADFIVEMHCYMALKRIQGIPADDTLDDSSCFYKIEEIVSLFEDMGSGGNGRHDFG